MLPQKERLSRAQFSSLLANKGFLVVYNKLGTLKYILADTKALSVVTSSKHEKKAVVRNKLRRRVYSIFGAHNTSLQGVLYTSKASYIFTYSQIQSLVHELLSKAHKNTR